MAKRIRLFRAPPIRIRISTVLNQILVYIQPEQRLYVYSVNHFSLAWFRNLRDIKRVLK